MNDLGFRLLCPRPGNESGPPSEFGVNSLVLDRGLPFLVGGRAGLADPENVDRFGAPSRASPKST